MEIFPSKQTLIPSSMNMKTAGTCIVQSTSRPLSFWNTTVAKTAAVAALLWGGLSAQAGLTNWSWNVTSPGNYSTAANWDHGTNGAFLANSIPNGTMNYTASITNGGTINYSSSDGNNFIGELRLGTYDNATATFTMNSGNFWITNNANYPVVIGGNNNFGSAENLTTANVGANANASLTLNGGTLVVARTNQATDWNADGFVLGLGTNSVGAFTNNNGTALLLCGVELGINGTGIFTVNGGTVVDNGWFGVGRAGGLNAKTGVGVFNLNGGTMYILRNANTDGASTLGGVSLCQGAPSATVNISGGTLYSTRIVLNSDSISGTPANENVNISGGNLYIGYLGVSSNGVGSESVNISGGTFHTVDMLTVTNYGTIIGSVGNTNNVLSDGTNWTWAANPPVNLQGSSFAVGGVAGPGYVTFAPEATRTITLNNVWSGVGGLAMNGPGTLAVNGVNTYSGSTMVNGGVLALGANGSIGSSSTIQVASGATLSATSRSDSTLALGSGQTLGGSGTVSGAISVGSGATIGGGSSTNIGTLNNTGSILLNGGGTLTVKVQNATTGAGVGNDSVAISGNIGIPATSGSKFTVKLVSLDANDVVGNSMTNFNNTTNYTWTIATGTVTNFSSSAFTVDTSAFANALGGGQFFVGTTGNSLVVYFKPASGGTVAGTAPSLSNVAIVSTHPTFVASGIPGYTYGVESATSLSGPWIEATNAIAGTNGAINVTDLSQTSPSVIFYRLYYPDNPSSPPQ